MFEGSTTVAGRPDGGFAGMRAGAELAAIVDGLVPVGLGESSDFELIEVMRACQRLVNRFEALQAATVGEFARRSQLRLERAAVPGLDGSGLDGSGLDGSGLDGSGLDGWGLERSGLERSGLERSELAASGFAATGVDAEASCQAYDETADEVAAALRVGARRAANLVEFGLELTAQPRIGSAMARGDLDGLRARILLAGLGVLAEHPRAAWARRTLLDRVLPTAAELTAGKLRGRVAREVIRLDPAAAQVRHEQAVERRELWTYTRSDGIADLGFANLPADRVAEACEHLDSLARKAKSAGDERTLDQLRCDVALALLTGDCASDRCVGSESVGSESEVGEGSVRRLEVEPSGRTPVRARIHLVAPIGALVGEPGEMPCELAGYGPILPAQALRMIARRAREPDSRFGLVTTDPGSGRPTSLSRLDPRVFRGLKREALEVIYPVCPFPSCARPAVHGEGDHVRAYASGGPTTIANGHLPCPRHHRMKTLGKARVVIRRLGTVHWTLPSGNTYASTPEPLTTPRTLAPNPTATSNASVLPF